MLSAKLLSLAGSSLQLIQQLECENERLADFFHINSNDTTATTHGKLDNSPEIIPSQDAKLLYKMLKAKSFMTIFQGPKNLLLRYYFKNFSSLAFNRNYFYRRKILRHLKRSWQRKGKINKQFQLNLKDRKDCRQLDINTTIEIERNGLHQNDITFELQKDDNNTNMIKDKVTDQSHLFTFTKSAQTDRPYTKGLSDIDQIFACIE